MKALVFDAGPIISFAINNLLWLIPELKKRFGGEFYITEAVQKELGEVPLKSKKGKFEAIQVQQLIENDVIKVLNDSKIKKRAKQLADIANSCFFVHKHKMQAVHAGEMETLAAAIELGIDVIVVDERVTRMFIERPLEIERRFERKLHSDVKVDKGKLRKFHSLVKHLKLIRSIELATIAYEHGLLDRYLVKIPNAKKILIESVLWALKLNGCSITDDEIETIIRVVKK